MLIVVASQRCTERGLLCLDLLAGDDLLVVVPAIVADCLAHRLNAVQRHVDGREPRLGLLPVGAVRVPVRGPYGHLPGQFFRHPMQLREEALGDVQVPALDVVALLVAGHQGVHAVVPAVPVPEQAVEVLPLLTGVGETVAKTLLLVQLDEHLRHEHAARGSPGPLTAGLGVVVVRLDHRGQCGSAGGVCRPAVVPGVPTPVPPDLAAVVAPAAFGGAVVDVAVPAAAVDADHAVVVGVVDPRNELLALRRAGAPVLLGLQRSHALLAGRLDLVGLVVRGAGTAQFGELRLQVVVAQVLGGVPVGDGPLLPVAALPLDVLQASLEDLLGLRRCLPEVPPEQVVVLLGQFLVGEVGDLRPVCNLLGVAALLLADDGVVPVLQGLAHGALGLGVVAGGLVHADSVGDGLAGLGQVVLGGRGQVGVVVDEALRAAAALAVDGPLDVVGFLALAGPVRAALFLGLLNAGGDIGVAE